MRHQIIPNLRYADAPHAIEFLCEAFGFERKAIYLDEQDPAVVQHAQLVWADQMVMLSSVNDGDFAKVARMKTAAEAGGSTVSLYLIVDDVDAHAGRARAAGAAIILGPADQSYGGRGYTAHDPEGNVWSFGNYDPWAA
uniref:VOC family protein n=1 Tax=uncultured Sphingomonas sp. TaxID=158754 RepID=UPI0035CC5A83